jgi:hypothetical protein
VRVLGSSQDNHFTANDFVENTFDVTTNSRRSDNTFERNYWSAYRGYDLSGDGFGDVPHRPVRLFSYIVEGKPAALILLRSFFVDVLEVAERVLPVLTPEALVDPEPRMREVRHEPPNPPPPRPEPARAPALIASTKLSKRFGRLRVLDALDLDIEAGAPRPSWDRTGPERPP